MTVDLDRLRTTRDALLARVMPRLRAGGEEWLDAAREKVAGGAAALAPAFAGAARRGGRGPLLDPAPADIVRLVAPDGPVLNPWSVEDVTRVVLLLEDVLRQAEGSAARAADLYEHGELGERIAVLRGLALVGAGEDGLRIVRDALRSNVRDLFAAAICENAFTSEALPDELFFQAVLKCVFVGLPLGRIERLEARATPELSRMLYAYVTERDAAGRSVPPDLWPIIALHPPPGARERLERAGAVAGGRRLPG